MPDHEYMWLPVEIIPEEIMQEYKLKDLIHNSRIYAEIRTGMYGLPQAGILAHDNLKKHLEPHGYVPTEHTPELWKHKTRDITFVLVVDDFGVKYTKKEDIEHLIRCLKQRYIVTSDWEGTLFNGITLDWKYDKKCVDLSMPGYIEKALQKFAHQKPNQPCDAPHEYRKMEYGPPQCIPNDESPELDKKGIRRIQEIVGMLLFYARCVNNTMLPALNAIAMTQAKATETVAKRVAHLLNYAATNPNATVRYHASDMVLHIHADASYLSEPQAKSRVAGFYFLSKRPININKPSLRPPKINGPVHVLCTILKHVVASEAEAKVGANFESAQQGVMFRQKLAEMGHLQPPTPIQTDNAAAAGIINDKVRQRKSRTIDMRFYWVRDRVRQGEFLVYWKPGRNNLADYHTKHHPPAHHIAMRSTYLHTGEKTSDIKNNLRGCINMIMANTRAARTRMRITPEPSRLF